MKIEMPRAKFLAAVRRDRHLVRQHAILVIEDFECAWVLRLDGGAFIAAGDQYHQPIVGGDAHLMGKDAGVDRSALHHLLARREVFVDAVDAKRTRIVERHQNVLGRNVRADVDGTGRQRYGGAVRSQGPVAGSMRKAVT